MQIQGSLMKDRTSAHEELKRALGFPEWYGNNLDALFDLTSTMKAAAVLVDTADMLNALGSYGCKLISVLMDASEETPDFSIRFE